MLSEALASFLSTLPLTTTFATALASAFAMLTAPFAAPSGVLTTALTSALAMFAAPLAATSGMLAAPFAIALTIAGAGPLAQSFEVGACLPDNLVKLLDIAARVLGLGAFTTLSVLALCECRSTKAYNAQSKKGGDQRQLLQAHLHPFSQLVSRMFRRVES